jgi:hypothetical protein
MSKIEVDAVEPQSGTTLTLGASGDTITIPAGSTITNNGTATGFGRTGTVNWDTTAKTANFTAVSGEGYFVNTTSGEITVSLPAGSAGAIVSLADYTNTWQTNNVIVNPDGSEKIGGIASSATLNIEGQSVTFLYVDATEGWKNIQDSTSNVIGNAFILATGGTITTCGDYKIHTFTGPGTFTVTNAGTPAGSTTVDYLVVAGGGGGGGIVGGGGGAGGYRESKATGAPWTASPLASSTSLPVSATAYPITIGGGGTGGLTASGNGGNGVNSIFSTITATGGGGGSRDCSGSGQPGGSGGGAANTHTRFGTGNTPPTSPSQGNNGGSGPGGTGPGAGGGGAIAVGSNYPASGGGSNGAPGGNGTTSSINGTPTARAGGGGGGTRFSPCTGGTGGSGGGGAGAGSPSPGNFTVGAAGTGNTGGGGGGGAYAGGPGCSALAGYAGGSGIVIIRYKFQ